MVDAIEYKKLEIRENKIYRIHQFYMIVPL